MGEDPRAVLERLIAENAEDFAGLSKLIGRNSTYIQQFIKRGSPKKLPETELREIRARSWVSRKAKLERLLSRKLALTSVELILPSGHG